MKKFAAFLLAFIAFLSFSSLAFADVEGSFTASNISYDPTAHTLSFDVSNFSSDTALINPINMIGILDLNANWSDYNNTLSTTCSNYTHCSVTMGQSDNNFSFPTNHNFAIGLIRFTTNNPEFHSQSLSYSDLFPSSTPTPTPGSGCYVTGPENCVGTFTASNASYNPSTKVLTFGSSNFTPDNSPYYPSGYRVIGIFDVTQGQTAGFANDTYDNFSTCSNSGCTGAVLDNVEAVTNIAPTDIVEIFEEYSTSQEPTAYTSQQMTYAQL